MNHRRRQQLQTIKAHEILIIGLFSVAELNTLLELLGEIGIRFDILRKQESFSAI